MQDIRGAKEYHRMLQVKHEISDIRIPDKKKLIEEQWEYVLCQKRIRERAKTPEQILAERQSCLAIWQLYERTANVFQTKPYEPPLREYKIKKTPKNHRSPD
jgi:hypothetical protein